MKYRVREVSSVPAHLQGKIIEGELIDEFLTDDQNNDWHQSLLDEYQEPTPEPRRIGSVIAAPSDVMIVQDTEGDYWIYSGTWDRMELPS